MGIIAQAVESTAPFVDVETMLKAWHIRTPDEWTIWVYASVIVSVTGALYTPVRTALAAVEAELFFDEVVKDPSMMFGQARFTAYHVKRKRPPGEVAA